MTMNILEISQPYIKKTGNKSRLNSDIRWGDRSRTLWFEVDNEYDEFLCAERIDGFLVALLPFAMVKNLNIRSDGYVSERLLYHLNTILLPSLSANIEEFHPINIDAKCDGNTLPSKHGVGTGLSCGVDSFYSVLKHINTGLKGFRLTHLTYFNLMNSPYWTDLIDSSRVFSNSRIDYVRPVAQELGLKLVTVDSNIDRLYNNFNAYTFRYFGTVLALQKLFWKYYWSSSNTYSLFGFAFDDITLCDLLCVQCVSNENTTFYSTGSEVTRLEKTDYISDFAVTLKYLNVCWFHLYNCGKCPKCKRTMLGLYALGKLDRYGTVFDIDYFYRNKNEYLGHMIHKLIVEKHGNYYGYYGEIYKQLTQQNIRIPLAAKMHAIKLMYSAMKQRLIRL